MPYIKLPETPFRHPEDAETQIKMAVEFHEQHFGRKPAGHVAVGGLGLRTDDPAGRPGRHQWLATDEAILERSLNKSEMRSARPGGRGTLPALFGGAGEGAQVAMIFRNHFISDQVGFVYYRWRVGDAMADFSSHLNNIRISLPEDGKNYLVSVILDGENAWEFYPGGGKEFLEAFYGRLQSDPQIRTVRVADHLRRKPAAEKDCPGSSPVPGSTTISRSGSATKRTTWPGII